MLFSQLISILVSVSTIVSAAAIKSGRSEDHVDVSPSVGGPHGSVFDDVGLIGSDHKRISEITLTGGCSGSLGRLSRLQLTYRDNFKVTSTVTADHGTVQASKKPSGIALETDEYISSLQISTYQKRYVGKLGLSSWTRISWLKVETSKGQKLECGSHVGEAEPVTLGKSNQALLYFSGRSGDMLDMLTAHWIDKSHF